MTINDRNLRNSRIIQFKIIENHTALQTAKKFNLSINQIFLILKQYKNGRVS